LVYSIFGMEQHQQLMDEQTMTVNDMTSQGRSTAVALKKHDLGVTVKTTRAPEQSWLLERGSSCVVKTFACYARVGLPKLEPRCVQAIIMCLSLDQFGL